MLSRTSLRPIRLLLIVIFSTATTARTGRSEEFSLDANFPRVATVPGTLARPRSNGPDCLPEMIRCPSSAPGRRCRDTLLYRQTWYQGYCSSFQECRLPGIHGQSAEQRGALLNSDGQRRSPREPIRRRYSA